MTPLRERHLKALEAAYAEFDPDFCDVTKFVFDYLTSLATPDDDGNCYTVTRDVRKAGSAPLSYWLTAIKEDDA